MKGVFFDPDRSFEKGGEVGHRPGFRAPFSQLGQPHQVQHQWGRENGIISLPGKLKGHFGAEKTFEVNEIPGRFLIVKGWDVTYID